MDMPQPKKESKLMTHRKQAGFTLLETMVALVILLGVSAVILSGLAQMSKTQGTINNRTEMHTSVRAATELLQQEIGQAGKISLPPAPAGGWQLLTPVPPNAAPDTPVTIFGATFTPGMNLFEGEWVTVDTGLPRESVQLQCPGGIGACPIGTNVWTATFTWPHGGPGIGVPASVGGSFSTGIVPPANGVMPAPPAGYAGYPIFPAGPPPYPYPNSPNQGSTGNVLKLYGDLNGDGNMVYVEYTCVQGTPNNPGFLYRNQVPWTAIAIPPNDPSMIVLNGVLANPVNPATGAAVPCFTYQLQTKGGANAAAEDYAFVTDVAVTLTVQTPNEDPQTHQFQTETKALLNVSPRNVYDAWQSATLDYTNRIQPMPLNLKGVILPNYQ
jgi:prepilin-type N-terminal cleavage/methylation domain-containing protein